MRTTQDAVSKLVEIDLTINSGAIDFAIETANRLTTDVCSSSAYSDETLELIERWLSAHFYSIRDPRTTKESIQGEIDVSFEGKTDIGLSHTRYGQQAMLIDFKGNLSALQNSLKMPKKTKAGLFWAGTSVS